MTLSYDYFDELVARQSSLVWYRIVNAYPDARTPLQKMELGTKLIQFYYGAKDDFGTGVVEGFRFAYDLGIPFTEVLNELVGEFQKCATERSRPKIYTKKPVPKIIGGISIPLTVAYTEEFEDDKLISRRYQDADGTVRIESIEAQHLVSFYQQKALDEPNHRNVFKFLVSKFCVESLSLRLEEEKKASEAITDTVTINPMEEPLKKHTSYQPMVWNGTQKTLGELFVELKRKGWIDEFNIAAIQAAFTPSENIGQVLRPGNNFKAIYTVRYKPSFDKIQRFVAERIVKSLK